MNSREGFRQERVKLAEEVERLETELALMKVTLQKEIEYKENMEKSHHSLLVEQRDLQSQLVSDGLHFSDDVSVSEIH